MLGPSLTGRNHTSSNIIKEMMSEKMNAIPKIKVPIVDVRDVAMAHLIACKIKGHFS